tara:strand:- start:307 stop:486 length:180 start_codon:yes stop_codon:yes gene_type:complete
MKTTHSYIIATLFALLITVTAFGGMLAMLYIPEVSLQGFLLMIFGPVLSFTLLETVFSP